MITQLDAKRFRRSVYRMRPFMAVGTDSGREVRRTRRINISTVSIVIFGVFVMSHQLKAEPWLGWLPVDLTIVSGACVGLLSLWCIVRGRTLPRALLWPLMLFSGFLLGVFKTEFHGYGGFKIGQLFTVTLLAAVAPFCLLRRKGDVEKFASVFLVAGTVLGTLALLLLVSGGVTGRLHLENDPIALGRIIGPAILYVVLTWLNTGGRVRIALFLPLAIVLVASGSRGPIFGTALALAVVALRYYVHRRRSLVRLIVGGVVIIGLLAYTADRLPEAPVRRIMALVQGEITSDRAASWRVIALQRSAAVIAAEPFGVGWGGFSEATGVGVDRSYSYPHNLIVEVALEAGWLPLLIVVVVFTVAINRAWRFAHGNRDARIVLAMLIFFAFNTLTSRDINNQYAFFAFQSVALSLRYRYDPARSG